MSCQSCGAKLPSDAKFCPKCGQRIEQRRHFCTKCGNELQLVDKFCDECGKPVPGKIEKQPSPYPPKPKYSFKNLTERCFLCSLPTPPGIVLCPRCGVRQTCFKCGRPLGPGRTIYHSLCPKCGHKKVKKKVQERIAYYRGQPEPTQDQIMAYYS